jgi:hypothetical protein
MPTRATILITYRCESCRGLFTIRQQPGLPPRYCPGCDAALRRLARDARRRHPAQRRYGVTPGLQRPPRGNPRKG